MPLTDDELKAVIQQVWTLPDNQNLLEALKELCALRTERVRKAFLGAALDGLLPSDEEVLCADQP